MFRPRLSNPSTSYPSRFNLFLVGGCAQFGGRQTKKQLIQKENITTTIRFKNLML